MSEIISWKALDAEVSQWQVNSVLRYVFRYGCVWSSSITGYNYTWKISKYSWPRASYLITEELHCGLLIV